MGLNGYTQVITKRTATEQNGFGSSEFYCCLMNVWTHIFLRVIFSPPHQMDFWFFFWCEKSFQNKSARLDPNYSLEGQTSNSKKCPKDFGAAISAIHTVIYKKIKSKIIIFKNIFDLTILLPNEMTRFLYFSWNLKKMHFSHNFMRNFTSFHEEFFNESSWYDWILLKKRSLIFFSNYPYWTGWLVYGIH